MNNVSFTGYYSHRAPDAKTYSDQKKFTNDAEIFPAMEKFIINHLVNIKDPVQQGIHYGASCTLDDGSKLQLDSFNKILSIESNNKGAKYKFVIEKKNEFSEAFVKLITFIKDRINAKNEDLEFEKKVLEKIEINKSNDDAKNLANILFAD